MEIWKDINGYEGYYQVSNLGNVKSLDRIIVINDNPTTINGKILKHKTDKRKYIRVNLSLKGKVKTFLVHRIVAEAFIKNENKYKIINHKDENPSNNKLENLEWCTQKYNVNYGTAIERKAKNMPSAINNIKTSKKVLNLDTKEEYDSIHEAYRQCGIHFQNIHKCCNGKRKTAGGYRWGYSND